MRSPFYRNLVNPFSPFFGKFSFCHVSWSSGRRISTVAFGFAFRTLAVILYEVEAIPIFIAFVASKISFCE
jgi:hypothetical protein